jgi:hypothetical protein
VKDFALVRLSNQQSEIRFDWVAFDGDDCFGDIHITVTNPGGIQRFDFGPCAVNDLRKLGKFFRDETQATLGGGFQNPDIRYYDVQRAHDGYRVDLRFEGNGLNEQFHIDNPLVEIDDEFLRTVYSP